MFRFIILSCCWSACLLVPEAAGLAEALDSDDLCQGFDGTGACSLELIQRRVAKISSVSAGAQESMTAGPNSAKLYWEEQASNEGGSWQGMSEEVSAQNSSEEGASAEPTRSDDPSQLPLRDPYLTKEVELPTWLAKYYKDGVTTAEEANQLAAAAGGSGTAGRVGGRIVDHTHGRKKTVAAGASSEDDVTSAVLAKSSNDISANSNRSQLATPTEKRQLKGPSGEKPAWLSKVASVDEEIGGTAPSSGHAFEHPDWLASCKTIFLDIGSSSGDNIRRLFEPEAFEPSNLMLTLQQVFRLPEERQKPGNESGLCALGMEPNPAFHDQLTNLTETYAARGWRAHVYPYAAWSADGEYPMRLQGEDGRPEGAHLLTGWVKEARGLDEAATLSFVGAVRKDNGATLVRTVDLGEFLQSIPRDTGVAMMLMDVQGAEYEILAKLVSNEMLCIHTVKSALVAPHAKGSAKHWQNSTSDFIGRSYDDIRSRVKMQSCGGKKTPILPLDVFSVPLAEGR